MALDLEIVTVSYGHADVLNRLIKSIAQLNSPDVKYVFNVIDNKVNDEACAELKQLENVRVLPGIDNNNRKLNGSEHHGTSLNYFFRNDYIRRSRFVVVMDPDFFVTKKNWIPTLIDHARAKNLAFLGSTWGVQEYTKIRYFPSIHFMLIDLEQVDVTKLDFRPDFQSAPGWSKRYLALSNKYKALRKLEPLLLIGTSRDTGYRIYREFADKARHECFQFVLNLDAQNSFGAKKFLSSVLPDRLSVYPRPSTYSTHSIIAEHLPDKALRSLFDEFQFKGELLGFHLRIFGKGNSNSINDVDSILKSTLNINGL